ncbi:carboxylesterase family protein [Grosmannia clavigera kw1407]|uniref:Carboxylesterase family protein n=1 Tax=Grosmannia clavigera (strain kw1407 / UAMH 11150) TaxID=655863 RepID=F0XTK0_GROCL|nr:carboxylesterase family protein [Grosmannia clavigera kw1407]EFW98703.1 carboxylesterase family protein [Grosmannia clavigera kw1407]
MGQQAPSGKYEYSYVDHPLAHDDGGPASCAHSPTSSVNATSCNDSRSVFGNLNGHASLNVQAESITTPLDKCIASDKHSASNVTPESLAEDLENFHLNNSRRIANRSVEKCLLSDKDITNPGDLCQHRSEATLVKNLDFQQAIEKHEVREFEWVLSLPCNDVGLAKGPDDKKPNRSCSVPGAADSGSEDRQIRFGCNLLQNRARAGSDLAGQHRTINTYTLVATPLGDEVLRGDQTGSSQSQTVSVSQTASAGEAIPMVDTFLTPERTAPAGVRAGRSRSQVTPLMLGDGFEAGSADRSRSATRSPASSVSRIEDTIEELDRLEDEFEAVHSLVRVEHVPSPEKPDDDKAARVAAVGRSGSTRKVVVAKAGGVRAELKATAGMTRTSSTRKPGVAPSQAKKQGGPAETGTGPGSGIKRMSITRPASLLPPKPPMKSSKPPTVSTFELPGEAVARRLKEQREKRMSAALSGNGIVAPTATPVQTPRRRRSVKPPTIPAFELPGEAISRRKREEHEAKIRRQEEEEKKRREFKARPMRMSTTPSSQPRETVASRARTNRMSMIGESGSAGGGLSVGGSKRLSVSTASPGRSMQQATGRGRVSNVETQSVESRASRATSSSTCSMSGKRSSVSAEEVQQQKLRGKDIYHRDNYLSVDRDQEKREREAIAKQARQEAAERSRILSREWAEKQKQRAKKLMTIGSSVNKHQDVTMVRHKNTKEMRSSSSVSMLSSSRLSSSSSTRLRPRVRLPQGTYEGLVLTVGQGVAEGVRGGSGGHEAQAQLPRPVEAFLGIPYAQTTAGRNRFRAPVALAVDEAGKGDDGRVHDATWFGARCVGAGGRSDVAESEDCLNANVYVSEGARGRGRRKDEMDGEKKYESHENHHDNNHRDNNHHNHPPHHHHHNHSLLPVVIYVHGGAFNSGCGAERDLASFVGHAAVDLVAVSFNYRVGALGFLGWWSERDGDGDDKEPHDGDHDDNNAPLNLGLLDQQALFGWVQANISFFGGDAGNVTVMGLSAGAHSIGHHLLHYPPGRAPFHKAILESGAPTARAVMAPDHPRPRAQLRAFLVEAAVLDDDVLVPPPRAIIDALRGLSAAAVVRASRAVFARSLAGVTWPFQPVVDGLLGPPACASPYIRCSPVDGWRQRRAQAHGRASMPVLTGFNTHEGTAFVPRDGVHADTDADFRAFFANLIPGLDQADMDLLCHLYPDPTAGHHETDARRLPPGITGRQWPRLQAAYAHYAYICPVLQTAHQLSLGAGQGSSGSAPVYVYEFAARATALDTANHGDHAAVVAHEDALLAYRPGLQRVSEAMHAAWVRFIASPVGDPNVEDDKEDEHEHEHEEDEVRTHRRQKHHHNPLPHWTPFVSPLAGNSAKTKTIMVFGHGNDERVPSECRHGGPQAKPGIPAAMRRLSAFELEQCRFWWDRVHLSEGYGYRSETALASRL